MGRGRKRRGHTRCSHVILCPSDNEGAGRLEAKLELTVKLREHLIARPAVLCAIAAGLVVEARVDDAAVALGRALCHIIRRLDHQNRCGSLGELPRDRRADTAGSDDDDVVRAVGLGGGVARARARARAAADLGVGGIADVVVGCAVLDLYPLTSNEGAAVAVDMALGVNTGCVHGTRAVAGRGGESWGDTVRAAALKCMRGVEMRAHTVAFS